MVLLMELLELSVRHRSHLRSEVAPVQPQPQIPPQSGSEYNVGSDFSTFEKTIASYTENAKNTFQAKLTGLVGNKKVLIRGSKGYGQPIKDYTVNVKSVSIDFYYDRYVVIFKDDKDKEYFLAPDAKVKILGPAERTKTDQKKKIPSFMSSPGSKPKAPAAPAAPAQPQVQQKQ